VDTIIGLGEAGCSIANKFANYPQYKIYKIDEGLKGYKKNGIYTMPTMKTAEEYEEGCPSMKSFFKDVSGDVLFVVCGAGKIASASLRVLEHLKHCSINILYIKPDLDFLSEPSQKREDMVRGVLQEYARSGVFEKIFIVDNKMVESALGSVPVAGYYDALNEYIVSVFHMINVYTHIKPIFGNRQDAVESARISTIGLVDLEKDEDKAFLDFDLVRQKDYFYGVNQERAQTDGTLKKKITESAKKRLDENTKVTYSVYTTQYEEDHGFCVYHTSKIQA
jgi:hypothetical protein